MQVVIVERTLRDTDMIAQPRPGLTPILRLIETVLLLGVDEGRDAIWLVLGVRQTDSPKLSEGRPELRVISSQVSPPSVDLKMPLFGPPAFNPQVRRIASKVDAYRTSGSWPHMTKSITPACSCLKRICFQVCPPSSLR